MKQKTYSVWVKNATEYYNNCAGDRQLSYGGFIALNGVIAYIQRELFSLVPVLHFVYLCML